MPERQHGSINTVWHSQHQEQFNMKLELLLLGTAPCVSTLCLPDVTAHNQPGTSRMHELEDTIRVC